MNSLLKKQPLPLFKQIHLQDIEPALDTLLKNNREKLAQLLKQKTFSFDHLILPLEEMNDQLHQMWSSVSHLNHVKNSKGLRKIYNSCLPKLTQYSTELSHNAELFRAIKSIKSSSEFKNLNKEQRRVIDLELRDFKLSGVGLSKTKKEIFSTLLQKKSKLCTKFSENILDATNAWAHHVQTKKTLKGLPKHVVDAAEQLAKKSKKKGFILDLHFPTYYAVMTYADDEDLRKTFYEAYSTRASDQGPLANKFDNTNIMNEILIIRHNLAALLNFDNYVDYSLATKMAKTPKEVLSFLNDLAEKSLKKAKEEMRALKQFAKKHDKKNTLAVWDVGYYSEKLKQKNYSVSQENLRPYFPEDKVLTGMFFLVEKLYGISIKEKTNVETWHKDVRYFEIFDENKKLRGSFYTDLYARKNKNGGAWMDECRIRRKLSNNKIELPVAYLTCNFSAPVGKNPSLLTHDEVITLFHEFGHCLQHLLTKMDYSSISGINGVEWDAVELPSQFMENFCWEKSVIDMISSHYQTGETLPKKMLDQLIASKNFQAGMQMIRQLTFGLFDIEIHLAEKPAIQKTLNAIRKKLDVIKTPAFNRFQHSFSHIFAGGYAAGYYSYKWAEVLSADAFSRFEEEGLFDKNIGRDFLKNILEKGGSEPALTLFKKFRKRKPSIDALLKHAGIEVQ